MKKTPRECANCGANIVRDSRKILDYTGRHNGLFTPTQYACGSVSSVHWTPPLFYCK